MARKVQDILSIPGASTRKEAWSELKDFIAEMRTHFEPVSLPPFPEEEASTDDASSSLNHSSSAAGSTSMTQTSGKLGSTQSPASSEDSFEWRFLDMDGSVWAFLKALEKRTLTVMSVLK